MTPPGSSQAGPLSDSSRESKPPPRLPAPSKALSALSEALLKPIQPSIIRAAHQMPEMWKRWIFFRFRFQLLKNSRFRFHCFEITSVSTVRFLLPNFTFTVPNTHSAPILILFLQDMFYFGMVSKREICASHFCFHTAQILLWLMFIGKMSWVDLRWNNSFYPQQRE